MAHLKGQNVNILLDLTGSGTYTVIAASSSCDFSVSPNTADGSAKDDANPMWDNPAFTYYDWSASNESFIIGTTDLAALITKVVSGNAEVQVQFQAGATGSIITKKGTAVISSLEVDAPCDDYAKLNLSFEGASALEDGTFTTITPVTAVREKMRGKALMLAINTGTSTSPDYKTICAATSHKLSISVQTADTKTKDENDKAIAKEVTGKSMTVSTENLITLHSDSPECMTASALLKETLDGNTLSIAVGYYPDSIGKAVGESQNWGAPSEEGGSILISGNFLCTSWTMNGANKEDATYSGEFTLQGAPTIATA